MPDLSLQHRFELITAPAAEPVTVTDAKKQIRIEHSDEDALIARLINVAIGFVDVRGALSKAMITQTWGEQLVPPFTRLPLSRVSADCPAVELPCTGYSRSDACQPEDWLRLAHYVSAG